MIKMSDKYVNHVNLATGEDVLDLRLDTVTEETMFDTVTAHDSEGKPITGKFPASEIDTQADLIEQIKTALVGKAAGGDSSSGSGIIDVTELPTSGIDENAVYRVTENIQTEKTEIYILASGIVTIQQYLTSLGVPTKANMYVVDELPADMLTTDVQTFTQLHFYILKSDGVAYANVPAYGGVITGGLFGFQAMGYDKGFTEDIYRESDAGIYTTIEAHKQITRWFVRENGEWKEITAHTEATTPHGCTNIDVYSGDVTSKIPSFAEFVSGEITEINEEWFRSKNGVYVDRIRSYAFADSRSLISLTIPNSIRYVLNEVCYNCINLRTITFKGTPKLIFNFAFRYCDNLTTINVPWSEGEVSGAPWGAENVTINYNYMEG